MLKGLFEYVVGLSQAEEIVLAERSYTTKQVHPVLDPQPNPLNVSTLTAMVDYIKSGIDVTYNGPSGSTGGLDVSHTTDEIIIHVEDEHTVSLLSDIKGNFMQRSCYMKAIHSPDAQFKFGNFMDVERFIVGVQSMFEADDNTARILKIVGNIQDGTVRTHQDDGVSQKVTVKTGVARVDDNIQVPSPVDLTPYRTFPEIMQPCSSFIFRMRSGAEQPFCALFEADGGRWKLGAVARIKAWFESQLNGVTVIA